MMIDSFHSAGDGILTHCGLLGSGYSPAEIRQARRTGDLIPLVRGSYASGPSFQASSPEMQHLHTARARVLDSPSIVLSHISAAVFHGLPVPADALGVVHVTRPGRGGSRRRSAFQQHAAVLAVEDISEQDRFRVTSISRTLIDLSRTSTFDDAVVPRTSLSGPMPVCPESYRPHWPGHAISREQVLHVARSPSPTAGLKVRASPDPGWRGIERDCRHPHCSARFWTTAGHS